MSHFRLNSKEKYARYLFTGMFCVMTAVMVGYAAHSIGTARARSRETVLIHTEEELIQFLLDEESEEFNLNGRYQLEEDLDLSSLERSIGTNLEPFTGILDGNGHVISGLKRPLFGVMKQADVENLFFSEVKIQTPAIYYDGEHYVDGYGALAAYAVRSEIRNCGMSGEIHTASPSEAEYLLEKAGLSDTEEGGGPGMEGPAGTQAENPESSPSLEGGQDGESEEEALVPGTENGTSGPVGPGVDVESGLETSQEATKEIGPGIESGEASGEESSSEESSSEESSSEEEKTEPAESTGQDSGNSTVPETTPSMNTEESTAGDGGSNKEEQVTQPEKETDAPFGGEHETREEAGTESSTESGNGSETGSGSESETGSGSESESGSGSGTESEAGDGSDVKASALEETVGFRFHERQHLLMKIPELADLQAVEEQTAAAWEQTATPSDATPSDAQEPSQSESSGNATEEQTQQGPEETKEIEYIGNPDGDIIILVTADRITAGGLIAEMTEETLVSDSFAMVVIDSSEESTDTYAGGLAGVIRQNAQLENSYAAGLADVSGVTGGFAAWNEGSIWNCYSSMTIGNRGTVRGAFTALESGRLNGCVYDRQMACTKEESVWEPLAAGSPAEAVEFSLLGLSTSEMTGADSRIPGTWRKADGAYPQLEYFALHEEETVSSNSKTSAIALILPEKLTLADVMEEGDLVLPAVIDGESVIWEAEGSIAIDEKHKVVTAGSGSKVVGVAEPGSSTQKPEEAGTAGESEEKESGSPEAPAGEIVMFVSDGEMILQDEKEPAIMDTKSPESKVPVTDTPETGENKNSSSAQLKASIGTASRTFAISAPAASRAVYADWGAVGEAVYSGILTGTGFVPEWNTTDYCYDIKTPEALAWFAYHVNVMGDMTAAAKLMLNMDLTGMKYGGTAASPLPWTPIGTGEINSYGIMCAYSGELNGNGKVIYNMRVKTDGNAGLFGAISGGAVIRKLGLDKSCVVEAISNDTSKEAGFGCFAGVIKSDAAGEIVLEDCYNRARVWGKDERTAAFIGSDESDSGYGQSVRIENCYTTGSIGAYGKPQGVLIGYSKGNTYVTVNKCYWEDTNDTSRLSAFGSGFMGTSQDCIVQSAGELKSSWFVTNLDQGRNIWTYDPDKNDNYPILVSTNVYSGWEAVGAEAGEPQAASSSNKGSAANPYLIRTPEDLAWLAYQVNHQSKYMYHAKLMADIDLFGGTYTGYVYDGSVSDIVSLALLWEPIGYSQSYSGTFDGNGHTISNIHVEAGGNMGAGLFGTIYAPAVVKSTKVKGIYARITSDMGNSAGIGGIAGIAGGQGVKILECANIGRLTVRGSAAANHVGGILGNGIQVRDKLLVEGCYNSGSISCNGNYVGGVVGLGSPNYLEMRNCYNLGMVATSGNYAGGLAGQGVLTISGCYNTGQVTSGSGSEAAGIVSGYIPTMTNCLTVTSVPDPNARSVTPAALKTWGAAYYLNEYQCSQSATETGLSWGYAAGTNGGMPYLTKDKLKAADTWEPIGEACGNNLLASPKPALAGTTYEIGSAEQLAWFACEVNSKTTNISAKLTADIDLFGTAYTGITNPGTDDITQALRWTPIGNRESEKAYTGTFDGSGHTISNIHLLEASNQGLFGALGTNAAVKNTKVKTVLGPTGSFINVGGIAGTVTGTGVKILECANLGRITSGVGSVGGCVGIIENTAEVLVEACYNGMEGIVTGKGNYVGGIIGDVALLSTPVTVRNCYNLGTVTNSNNSATGGIVGYGARTIIGSYNAGQVMKSGGVGGGITGATSTSLMVNYCLTISSVPDINARSVSEAQLKTWGAAYYLNGGMLSQSPASDISWDFKAETNNDYPYLTRETLNGACEWAAVIEGVVNEFVTITKPTGTPRQISSAEQLAWFAYEVNNGNPGLTAKLTADIDLFGTKYSGKTKRGSGDLSNALSWTPIGAEETAKNYTGTFDGDGHIISNIYLKGIKHQGLFAALGTGAVVKNTKVNDIFGPNATDYVGGIAGSSFGNGVKILECGNLGNFQGKGGGAGGILGFAWGSADVLIEGCYNEGNISFGTNYVGGVIGDCTGVSTPVTVRNCYNLGTVATEGQNVGGIAGGTVPTVISCYNAGQVTGTLGVVGGITGKGTRLVTNCLTVSDAKNGAKLVTQDQMKTWGAAYYLNKKAYSQSPDTDLSWGWEDGRNGGYPYLSREELSRADGWNTVMEAVAGEFLSIQKPTGDPYLIRNADQLAWFAYEVNQGSSNLSAKLVADIDLMGSQYSGTTGDVSQALRWTPIGNKAAGKTYRGTFDGNGYTVSNIRLLEAKRQGLFGALGVNATVKNTKVETVLGPVGSYGSTGGIAGLAEGTGVKILECGNLGRITSGGGSLGGCVGEIGSSADVLVEGCYNAISGSVIGKDGYVGGVVGDVASINTPAVIRNCYNLGTVTNNSNNHAGGIIGYTAKTIIGCYNAGQVTTAGSYCGGIAGSTMNLEGTNCITISSVPDPRAKEVALDQPKTWGAAFYLNGGKVSQSPDSELSWDFDAGENDGFPYLTRAAAKGAGDWDTVMAGAVNGFITISKPTGDPYQISSAEQLAWLAYEVNHGKPAQSAVLVQDIDMKTGEARFTTGERLNWTPIGNVDAYGTSIWYTGTLESRNLSDLSDTGIIWKIQNLYCRASGNVGLIGHLENGTVSGIGIVNGDITEVGNEGKVGGIVGAAEGSTIRRCYNRKEGSGKSRVTVQGSGNRTSYGGGIVGMLSKNSVAEDCYSLDMEITASELVYLGGITGNMASSSSIRNCYSALNGGKLESSYLENLGYGTGSIAGSPQGNISGCWREKAYKSELGTSDFGAASDTSRQSETNALNTLEGSGERTGSARSWYTSIMSEATRGLPTLEAPKIMEITIEPAESPNGRTAALPQALSSALYRGIREEAPGDIPALPLTSKTDVATRFYTMGTDNANGKLGMMAGDGSGADLSTLAGSLIDPKASIPNFRNLYLYTGGAYTYQKDRMLLLDVADSGVRYEIRIRIPGVASKKLSVTLPVKVEIEELNPTGSAKTSYSADVKLTNNNNFPIKGSILGLTPIRKEGYVELKPVAKKDSFGSTRQLTDPDGGVRLGIADTKTAGGIVPASGLYYTPAKGSVVEKWMEYQIKGQGILPYRYFIEYEANPYFDDTNQYGYTVNYSFGISNEDMETSAEAVAK